jgi:hypothetical protein
MLYKFKHLSKLLDCILRFLIVARYANDCLLSSKLLSPINHHQFHYNLYRKNIKITVAKGKLS